MVDEFIKSIGSKYLHKQVINIYYLINVYRLLDRF